MKWRVTVLLLLTVTVAAAFSPIVLQRRSKVNPAAAPPPFSPTNVSGLIVWLKADAITAGNGDAIETWEDSSAANNDATEPDAIERPNYFTSQIDGLPALVFDGGAGDGGEDWLRFTGGGFSGLTAGEVFFVVKMDADPAASDNDAIIDWTGPFVGPGDSLATFSSGGVTFLSWGRDEFQNVGNLSQDVSQWFLLNISSANNDWKVRVNGSLVWSTNINTVTFTDQPYIGGDGSAGMKGKFAEIIWYDNVISAGNRTSVQTYLDNKYPSLGL